MRPRDKTLVPACAVGARCAAPKPIFMSPPALRSPGRLPMPGMTISEKILARASGTPSVRAGQVVDGYVDLLYMHEMLALAIKPFDDIGVRKIWDPSKCVVTIDHWVPPPNEQIARMHQAIREFCWAHGIQRFHDMGDHGIIHQLVVERGYVHPGMLVIGSDSHTNMAGAMTAAVSVTPIPAVMATGKLWL